MTSSPPTTSAGVDVRPGDAVLFHTGWGELWHEDPDRYGSGEPGPGMALADWLADHRVALTGCDTWSYGPVPAEDPDQPFVVPQTLNTRHGVVVVENLFLSELARDARHRVPARDRPPEAVRRHRRLGRPPRHRLRSETKTDPAEPLKARHAEHFDVIVIGSGAGGGTLAHALAPTGKRILILERGDFIRREKQNWNATEVWINHRYRNSGNWTDKEGGEFLPKQHYYVGGNTKMYGAVLFRKRERDFGEVHHVDGDLGGVADLLRRPGALLHRGPSSSTTCTANARSTRSSRGRRGRSPTRR